MGRTLFTAALGVLLFWSAPARARQEDREGLDFFETKIRPVLADRCYHCHSADSPKLQAGLRLDTWEGFAKTIVPGDPEKSRLVVAIRYTDEELRMPPKKRLTVEQVADFESWIKRGAPYPKKVEKKSAPHWAWVPPKEPPVPDVKQKEWVKTPIDSFILAGLEKRGLEPSPPADKRTLLRRATYDLLGLPPTAEEFDAFLADDSPDAFARVVDRLLASPRFGERWGRHWLDVARYSDTKGYLFEEERRFAYAYTYRDWVIRAFNEDLAYDQFLIHQIAADRVVGEDKRPLAAMGFLTVGRRFLNNPPDIIDDRIDVVTRGTMGLTVGCARCHDHKYDPIPTKDYYSLYGVFDNSPESGNLPRLGPGSLEFDVELKKREAAIEQFAAKRHAEITASLRKPAQILAYLRAAREGRGRKDDDLEALANDRKLIPHVLKRWVRFRPRLGAPLEIAAIADPWPAAVPIGEALALLSPEDNNKLKELRMSVEDLKVTHSGSPPHAMTLEESSKPHPVRVFVRGNPGNPGPEVPRKFPDILGGQAFKAGSGRLELARAIASKDNPLTARVWVNRVWGHLWGAAIVRTPSDFGTRSEPPTHPELLDWLALRLIADGWSTKKLIRLVLLSSAYQQSSDGNRDVDPENRLFGRMNRKRLDFEGTRDSLLAVSGRLDLTMYGHPVSFEKPRRSIYLYIERQNLPGLFRTFDFAIPDTHSPGRFTTTVPQQALFLMNSPFMLEGSRRLAALVPSPDIPQLYRLVFGRAATDEEVALGRRFLEIEERKLPDPNTERARDWQYGYGTPEDFKRLPHFTGTAWQGGSALPDPKLGWVLLTAGGGHPGRAHAAIRRWVAPKDGVIEVAGMLGQPDPNGDGVVGRIVSSRLGEIASWIVDHREVETKISSIEVTRGDTIDFVVECRENEHCDSFSWAPVIRMGSDEWNAAANFSGPMPKPLTAWERYAQALLLTNEFSYVD